MRHRRNNAYLSPARNFPSHPATYAVTEMQDCLLRSTHTNPTHNVIEYVEIHPTSDVPQLMIAWKEVLGREQLFRMAFSMDEHGAYMHLEGPLHLLCHEAIVKDEV